MAITPFVLQAGAGPFVSFSLLDGSGNPRPQYQAIKWLSKVKGQPEFIISPKILPVLGDASVASPSSQPKLMKSSQNKLYDTLELITQWLKFGNEEKQ